MGFLHEVVVLVQMTNFSSSKFFLNKTTTMVENGTIHPTGFDHQGAAGIPVNNCENSFSDDRSKLFIFSSTYEDSTLTCYFSPTVNLHWLSKSLWGIAKFQKEGKRVNFLPRKQTCTTHRSSTWRWRGWERCLILRRYRIATSTIKQLFVLIDRTIPMMIIRDTVGEDGL